MQYSPGLIDLKTTHDQTALHLAASGGHVKVVAELLARRPSSLADEDWEGRTPLFCAVSEGHQEDLFPLTTDQVCVSTPLIFVFSTILSLFSCSSLSCLSSLSLVFSLPPPPFFLAFSSRYAFL